MIEPIRSGILGVEGAADDIEEDYSAMEKGEGEVIILSVIYDRADTWSGGSC